MAGSPERWQKIGWGGISFRLPPDWHPTLIFDSYLFFEQQGQPAFAIKWQRIQGHFSPERILKKLHQSLKPAGHLIEKWELPQNIKELLPAHSMTGFQWQENHKGCCGILLYCPDCRQATLLQLYGTERTGSRTFKNILASFADHADDGDQLWSMYDIKASLPVQARLTSHEFLVGRFTLTFDYKGTALTLYRFKPAAAILSGQTLSDFGGPLAESAPCTMHGTNKATWSRTVGGAKKLMTMLQRKPAWIRLQLWQIPEKNVILGVKGAGKRPLGEEIITSIAKSFTAL